MVTAIATREDASAKAVDPPRPECPNTHCGRSTAPPRQADAATACGASWSIDCVEDVVESLIIVAELVPDVGLAVDNDDGGAAAAEGAVVPAREEEGCGAGLEVEGKRKKPSPNRESL